MATEPGAPSLLDVDRLRAETPGTAQITHLNAAGAALAPSCVTAAVTAHLQHEAARGAHWAAQEASGALARVRDDAATLLGAPPHGIAFGDSATRLWAHALSALPLQRGDRILLARGEWGGNILNALRRTQALGVTCELIPSQENGRIDITRLAGMIDERVRVIAVPMVSSGVGIAQPVAAIGRLPRPETCLFIVDGAQAVGRVPVALRELAADIITAPSRKWLRGPRGQAVRGLSEAALARLGTPLVLDLAGARWSGTHTFAAHPDATRFESFEFSVAARVGLGVAIRYALDLGIAAIAARVAALVARLQAGLAAMRTIACYEPPDCEAAFVTFRCDGIPPHALTGLLKQHDIMVASVERNNAPWEFAARGLESVNRVAPHGFNTEAEIDRFLAVLARLSG